MSAAGLGITTPAGIETLSSYEGALARCSDVLYSPNLVLRSHHHDLPSISICLSGTFEETVAGESFRIGVSSILVSPADTEHSNRLGNEHCRALHVEFFPDALQINSHLAELLSQAIVIESRRITSVARRISDELPRPDAFRHLMLDGLLVELTALLLRAKRGKLRPVRPEWVGEAAEFLSDHFVETVTVNSLAGRFRIHPSHFGRVFKREMHHSVGQHIQHLRVEKAAELLRVSNGTISQIGERCGFSDQAHFTRVFKQIIGRTPRVYRDSLGGATPTRSSTTRS